MIAAPSVQAFDPRSVRGLPPNSRRLVERWLAGCASRTTEVFSELNVGAALSFTSLASHSATDAMASLSDPDIGAVFAIAKSGHTSLLSMPQHVLLALLYGMIGVRAAEWPAGKPLSTIEESLAEMLFERIRREWSEAWPQRDPIPFAYRKCVNRSSRSRVFDPGQRLLVASFEVKLPCGEATIQWLASLDDVEALASPQAPPAAARPANELRIADVAPLVPLPMSVELGRVQLSLAEAESLQCGDVLVLDQTVRASLVARVAGLPKYRGRPGRIGSRVCFAIESLLEE